MHATAPTSIHRVVIIDDEALVRQGFTMILEAAPDIRVVGSADGRDAIRLIERARPDVVLLDIRMPGTDGLTVLRALRSAPEGDGGPRVAMLTTFDGDRLVAESMALGASGFLLKDTDPEALPQFVRTLAAGGTVLAPAAANVIAQAADAVRRDPVARERIAPLSERERQVLRNLALGLSNAEIGERLHLGTGTVKDHVSSLLAKLGVPNRVQAAIAAERAGLLEDER